MVYKEKWGDSIDAAVELALQEMKLTRDQVTVTVLEEPSRGFFGLGSHLAKVRVEKIEAEKEEKPLKAEKPEKAVKQEKKPERQKTENKERRQKREAKPKADAEAYSVQASLLSERPDDLVPYMDSPAQKFLEETFEKMGLKVNVKTYKNNECVYVDVDGEDCGTVIGKRGQTLDAIQYLTSLVVNKGQSNYIRTIIDAEGYRQKREETLEKLAMRLAEKAVKTRRYVRLEPMNPYERKVIHSVLQQYPGVTTRSEGEEPYRRVIIEPEK